ncbi:MAG TPA: DUF4160 domain-containing protein [Thermoanaerobaculia bacterium]|nr:DUF4160 domain-containing protein [Thermoanaerobaculia bacterium]
MPEISRFFGIIVLMYYNDHPPPHFHIRYGEQKAILGIESLTLLHGKLTPRVLGLVVEWASSHQEELMDDWERARRQEPLRAILPLE